MALTPPLVYASLESARRSGGFPFDGVSFSQLASAIASGVVSWLPTGVVLKGVSVGTAGVGTINTPTTRLVLTPNPSLVISGLRSAGMEGPLSVSLGTVVALALAQVVSVSGQYAGGVVGVGIGGDVSNVVTADGQALTRQLAAYMASMLGPGPARAQMAAGLGTGIAALFLTVTGSGTVVGSPSLASATGQSTSVVV